MFCFNVFKDRAYDEIWYVQDKSKKQIIHRNHLTSVTIILSNNIPSVPFYSSLIIIWSTISETSLHWIIAYMDTWYAPILIIYLKSIADEWVRFLESLSWQYEATEITNSQTTLDSKIETRSCILILFENWKRMATCNRPFYSCFSMWNERAIAWSPQFSSGLGLKQLKNNITQTKAFFFLATSLPNANENGDHDLEINEMDAKEEVSTTVQVKVIIFMFLIKLETSDNLILQIQMIW